MTSSSMRTHAPTHINVYYDKARSGTVITTFVETMYKATRKTEDATDKRASKSQISFILKIAYCMISDSLHVC